MRGLVAACLVASCTAEPVATNMWHGDKSFSDSERASIAEGEAWMAEQVGEAPRGVLFDVPHDDGVPQRKSVIWRGLGPAKSTGEQRGSTIWLDLVQVGPEYVVGLAAHEVGHWYGLADDYGEDGIMGGVDDLRWSDRDHAQCVRIGRCR